jgi:hypothetical protein
MRTSASSFARINAFDGTQTTKRKTHTFSSEFKLRVDVAGFLATHDFLTVNNYSGSLSDLYPTKADCDE